MKSRRVINVILSALMIITLCFCMFGCTPSEEDINKAVLEERRNSLINVLENERSTLLDLLEKNISSGFINEPENAFLTKALLTDYMKALIDDRITMLNNAETLDQVNLIYDAAFELSYLFQDFKSGFLHFGAYLNTLNALPDDGIEFKTDDGLVFSLLYKCINFSSSPGYYFSLVSKKDNLKCICLSENNVYDKDKSELTIGVAESTPIINRWLNTYGYLDFIFTDEKEILGYAIIDWDKHILIKAVTFNKTDRENITEQKVCSYINKAKDGIDGEQEDNIVPVTQIVNFKQESPSISILPWQTESNNGLFNGYNEIMNGEKTDDFVIECWSDNGEFYYKDKITDKAILECGESIYWGLNSIVRGYIVLTVNEKDNKKKSDYFNEIILIKMTEQTAEEKYLYDYPTVKVYSIRFDCNEFGLRNSGLKKECFVRTIKRLIEEGTLTYENNS